MNECILYSTLDAPKGAGGAEALSLPVKFYPERIFLVIFFFGGDEPH